MSTPKPKKKSIRFLKKLALGISIFSIGHFLGSVVKNELDVLYKDRRLQSPSQVQSITRENKSDGRDYAILVTGKGAWRGKGAWSGKGPLGRRGANLALERAYQTFKNRGYSDENIILLSDKIPVGRDVNSGITSSATTDNLKNVLTYASRNAGDKGSITLFFLGHGGSDGTIQLREGTFKPSEIYDTLKGNKSRKILIFDSCYSGKLVNTLKRLDGDVCAMSSASGSGLNLDFDYDFWSKVDDGKRVDKAYEEAIKEKNSTIKTKLARTLYLGTVKNDVMVYNPKNINIPYPFSKHINKSLEEKFSPVQQPLKSLEKTTINSFLVFSLLIFAFLFLSPNLTGNAIGNLTNSTSNTIGVVLLVVGLIAGFFWVSNRKK